MASATTVSSIIGNENARLQAKLSDISGNVDTQTRLMLLNDSHRKRTTKYSEMMVYFVIGAVLFGLVTVLPNYFPVIPSFVVTTLSVLVIVFTIYLIASTYSDVSSRSSGNFDEIDIPPLVDLSGSAVDISLMQSSSTPSTMGNVGLLFRGNECYGNNCCGAGTALNESVGKCLPYCDATQAATASNYTGATAVCTVRPQPFETISNGLDLEGVSIFNMKSNLEGVSGDFVTSGQQYVRPDLINVTLGQIA
jgi:hypothetical protein